MLEKHICKLCSKQVEQLARHLTTTHSIDLIDYLTEFDCGEEYQRIQKPISISRRSHSPFCIEFYLAKGLSIDEARLALKNVIRNKPTPTTFPSDPEHWVAKGMTQADAKIRSEQYRKSLGGGLQVHRTIALHGKKEGQRLHQEYQNSIKNRQKTYMDSLHSNGLNKKSALIQGYLTKTMPRYKNSEYEGFRCNYSFSDFTSYVRAVKIATGLSILLYRDLIDPGEAFLGRNYARKGWGLDHQFSKYGGFYHHIDPLIISSPQNLRVIPHSENLSKGSFCTISIEEIKTFKTILEDEDIQQLLRDQIREIFIQTN